MTSDKAKIISNLDYDLLRFYILNAVLTLHIDVYDYITADLFKLTKQANSNNCRRFRT